MNVNLWRVPIKMAEALRKTKSTKTCCIRVATLEQRFDKTVPVSAWYVKILLCFVMNDSECSGNLKLRAT